MEIRYDEVYFLTSHLDSAIAVQASAIAPAAPHRALGFDERRIVSQLAPSAYRFPGVPTGPGARFLAAPAMAPHAWDQGTDGVVFEALCSADDGSWIELLRLTVDPAGRASDRVWHDRDLDLAPCSQPQSELELRVGCGPRNDCARDFAWWGAPRALRPRTLKPRFERIALLISIDTLRPDRLSTYGAERRTSPELDKLAQDGIVFENAMASAPWTTPSHATMLSSTYPRVHGASKNRAIAGAVPLLAEILDRAGWQTAGFVDTAFLGRKLGFHRGFEHFDDGAPPAGDYRRGAPVLRQRILDWLATADTRPAFLFWHVMDVHGPYWSSAPFGERFRGALPTPAEPDPRLEGLHHLAYHDYLDPGGFSSFDDLVATYDAGIAATDAEIGVLIEILRSTGLYDEALILVTSDHGESLLDHGVWVGHGLFLTDDELRVPLIVKLPGNRRGGTRVRDLAGLLDVTPTILDALGLEMPEGLQGRSLISDAPRGPDEPLFGLSSNTGASFLRTSRFKYIAPATEPAETVLRKHLRPREDVSGRFDIELLTGEQLYDLQKDPGETAPLAVDDSVSPLPSLRSRLAHHLEESAAWREGVIPPPATPLTPEEKERLRALGYVD